MLSRFLSRKNPVAASWDFTTAQRFVELAYRTILKRPPDKGGLDSYATAINAGEISALKLLEELLASDEARSLSEVSGLSVPRGCFSENEEQVEFSEQMQSAHLAQQDYENTWQQVFASGRDLIIGQDEYGRTHKTRFYELFNAVAYLLRECSLPESPQVLEFGASEFSAMYRSLFPDAILDFADRPVPEDYVGFTEARVRGLTGCRSYYVTDLEQPADIFRSGIKQQSYDLIVITEVLEHLVVNPVELCRQLLKLLKPDGCIYLTTPNFYSYKNITLLQQGRNPTEYYPESGGNWDAHYHHREYSASEMTGIIKQSGGKLWGGYFSDCWDNNEEPPVEQRGNMVFVFGHNQADQA